ncbi:MAG: 30S ribosomal protein S6 [Candidatus Gracilibacteria bacterium]|nr:30S ribosomal protein S6 [Candidatus Gracilibacteria bacterium]MDQ7023629.1 30S ribosomal protein S6 [Candidatus Gracilibacteria bacterium]
MVNYELMMIVDPTLSDEEKTAKIDIIKGILDKAGAKITKEDIIGDKKLAYPINKKERAFYALYNLELDGTKIKEISKEMNLNRSIWRYMFVKIED